MQIPESESMRDFHGPHFCSMKITEDVRKFAAEQGISETEALESGLREKAKEFKETGAEVYAKL